MDGDVNVLVLEKDEDRYLFLFDDESKVAVMRTFGRFAADKRLSFTWNDAALLVREIRGRSEQDAQDDGPAWQPGDRRLPPTA